MAEQLSDSPQVRARLRDYLQKNARILTTIGTKENKIYKIKLGNILILRGRILAYLVFFQQCEKEEVPEEYQKVIQNIYCKLFALEPP